MITVGGSGMSKHPFGSSNFFAFGFVEDLT